MPGPVIDGLALSRDDLRMGLSMPTSAELSQGTQVGEYIVMYKLGEGAFGHVYAAEHPVIAKRVAIKVLNRQFSADPEMVSRFVAEARAVNQIGHRSIIDIFGFGELPDSRHYYVMEYLDGLPFDAYLEKHGPLPLVEALPLLRQIAQALDAAHNKGILHRDLKPENVYVSISSDGEKTCKLLDFGIAKLVNRETAVMHKTRTGAPIGTPYYMSPEQCRGRDVDQRTDIYSFGCMIYQVLSGQVPFDGEDAMEILVKQMTEDPKPILTPPELNAPVLAMMAKDPSGRPNSASAALQTLEEAAGIAGRNSAGPVAAARPRSQSAEPPRTLTSQTAQTLASATPGVAALSAADLSTTQPPVKPKKITWLVAAALLASALGLGVVKFVSSDRKSGRKSDAKSTQPAPATASTLKVAPSKAPTLSISGTPRGAKIETSNGLSGTLPAEIALPKGETIEITISAPMFQSQHKTLQLLGDESWQVNLVASEVPNLVKEPRRKKSSSATDKVENASGKPSRDDIEDPFANP